MDSRVLTLALFATVLIGALALFGLFTIAPQSLVGEYDRATVTIEDGETGAELATIEVRIADTWGKRVVGLSGTDSLPANEGMLFVHDEPGEYGYVMRNMAFGIDIVFIDADGTITTIHEAHPEDEQPFEGSGKYVLEVNVGFTAEHGIEGGDRVVIDW